MVKCTGMVIAIKLKNKRKYVSVQNSIMSPRSFLSPPFPVSLFLFLPVFLSEKYRFFLPLSLTLSLSLSHAHTHKMKAVLKIDAYLKRSIPTSSLSQSDTFSRLATPGSHTNNLRRLPHWSWSHILLSSLPVTQLWTISHRLTHLDTGFSSLCVSRTHGGSTFRASYCLVR